MHRYSRFAFLLICLAIAPLAHAQRAAPVATGFTLEQVLDYPYPSGLVAAEGGERIAWVVNSRGVRNVWVADGPGFEARQVTAFDADDGREITGLAFSPSGDELVFVRGGDHHANWPGALAPDPVGAPDEPSVAIWAVDLDTNTAHEVAEGDAPTLSADGRLAYLAQGQVWTASLDKVDDDADEAEKKKHEPKRLFFDRGKAHSLRWSPDGKRLAFVSNRDNHAFIGVYRDDDTPITYLSPSTGFDSSPRWSPDGTHIAFVRQPGDGGPPQSILERTPRPWSIHVADAASGEGRTVWTAPHTFAGSFPETQGGANLHWAAGGRLVFAATLDGWPHLYSIAQDGGQPLLLTPGEFMVEHVAQSRDRRHMIYDANTGTTAHDHDRRHLFQVPVDRAQPVALTQGEDLQWQPATVGNGHVAFIEAGAREPPRVAVLDTGDGKRIDPRGQPLAKDYPVTRLVVPESVQFTAEDDVLVHGQLFRRAQAGPDAPGIVFVHGGPPRQMLLGWNYMDYYSNAYAVNQYLAAQGFVVLSINYRLGIGYGQAFRDAPPGWGPTGAAEYRDVLAGARFLQELPGVDADRIGIWGGSYGGYLTALGLARDSDLFKAGVDLHGVHDWSRFLALWVGKPGTRYEQGDREQAMKIAFESSPVADMDTWKSPVLLIHGDDDRNVGFVQTVDLARRLTKHGVRFEERILPNEIHGFLRHASWLEADRATVDFFRRELMGAERAGGD
jgi:dipeptidyl aminopeptidase/acylaminoacyl peptidase